MDGRFSTFSEGFFGLHGGLNVATSPTEAFSYIALPYGFVSLVSGVTGVFLGMRRPYRFSVRGALIATATVAVVLATGIVMSR
jgi:hypothetical protein